MKLLHFAHSTSIHTIRWLSAFVTLGHEVHLATTDTAAAHPIPGVIVHNISIHGTVPTLLRPLVGAKKGREIARKVNPDIIHGHMISSCGGYAAHCGIRPLVMTAWGSDVLIAPYKSRLRRLVTRWRLAQCDLVTTNSEYMKRAVMALGVPEDHLALVLGGVKGDRLRSFRGSRRLRQLAGVPPDAFVVLSTRWFEPIYNLGTVLLAVPKILSRTEKNVYFVFLGGGSLRSRLETQARELGVQEHVRFVEKLDHEELEECYGGADAYVSVSQSDGMSMSLLEAMAAGLPVVVSDVPSNLEWVQDGWNGHIVPRGDVDAVTRAILCLSRERAACLEFGARSMRIVAEKADYLSNMRKMEGLYAALARSRRGTWN